MNRPASDLPDTELSIGPWRLEPRSGRLHHNGRSLRLEPRVMQTLLRMLESPGAIVTRDELMSAVWGHTHISEDALNRTISRLRRTFAEMTAPAPEIETIPKVGYRLRLPDIAATMPAATGSTAPVAAVSAAPMRVQRRRWLTAFGLACVVLGAFVVWMTAPLYAPNAAPPENATVRPLTAYAGLEIQPSFSPDGTQAVFAWDHDTGHDWDLFVRPVNGEGLLQLTRGEAQDFRPVWSPDGGLIAFIRIADGLCTVQGISPVGGPLRKLADCDPADPASLAWSPDARWLAYVPVRPNGGKPHLALLAVDTGQTTELPAPPEGEDSDGLPAFSPNGRELAFVRWHAPLVGDIYVRNLETGAERRVTQDWATIYGYAWVPDGKRLFLSSNRAGDYALWQVSAAGGTPTRVTAGTGRIEDVSFSRDGRRMIYQEWQTRVDIYRVDPGPAESEAALIESSRWDWLPQPSPDGGRIAFASDRSGAAEIWVADADGGNALRLTDLHCAYVGRPRWSADGNTLAFEAAVAGNFDVYTLRLDDSTPQRLTDSPAEDLAAAWSPDGRYLYFTSRRSGGWQIWRHEFASGTQQQLTEDRGYLPQPSADGRWLYYTKRDEGGLWRISASGGAAERIGEVPDARAFNAWTIAHNAVYAVTHPEAQRHAAIVRQPLDGGSIETVAQVPRMFYLSGLSVMPDGALLYAKIVRSDADLLLVENPDRTLAPSPPIPR